MQHVRFGRTGLQVSRLCLGTMTFGLQCDEADLVRHPRRGRARAASPSSTPPTSTRSAARRRPSGAPRRSSAGGCAAGASEFIVATKCSGKMGAGALGAGHLAQAHARRDRRLARASAPTTSISTRCTSSTRRRRSTRRCGPSTTSCAAARRATSAARTIPPTGSRGRSAAARRSGWRKFDSVQPRYNLLFRQIERELLPLCEEEGLAVIPYNPLAGGFLSGKHSARAGRPRARASRSAPPGRCTPSATGTSASSTRSRRSRALAKEAASSSTTLAVAWVLAHPAITVADHRREQARAARRRASPRPSSSWIRRSRRGSTS